ncbi:killer cell lectin-like receptor subfamily F member 1 isoform X2 [Ambystoma mexicanum]|uniref:killer cell lectin-like receptor subfamily F member 1 isoform X2 n=1 Tax=Ambystoma mexicanum TaxID=8296 RepID=UPI0037E95780
MGVRKRGTGAHKEGQPCAWALYAFLLVLLFFLKMAEVASLLIFGLKPTWQCNSTLEALKEPGDILPTRLREALEEFENDLCDRTDAPRAACKLCPLHWIPQQEKCYYFSDEKKNWPDGQRFCQRRKAEMVSLDDSSKKEFVTSMLSSKKGYFWLGLRKQGETWRWMTGAELDRSSFPIKEDNGSHDCISGKDTFSSESCFNPNKYICEKNTIEFPQIIAAHTRPQRQIKAQAQKRLQSSWRSSHGQLETNRRT